MARPKNTESRKSVQVSTSIRPELHAALDDYRWTARLEGLTEIARVALEEYAVNHDVKVPTPEAETEAGK